MRRFFLGFADQKPKKKSAGCAQISRKVRSWWNFTTPLEPILRKNAELHKPRRLAQQSRPAPHPENPLHYFFWSYPHRDFLN